MPVAIPLVAAVVMGTSYIAIAGAALALVGALTDNKTLSMVGTFVGLAGGFAAGGGTLGGDAVVSGAEATPAATEALGNSTSSQLTFEGGDVPGQVVNASAEPGTTTTADIPGNPPDTSTPAAVERQADLAAGQNTTGLLNSADTFNSQYPLASDSNFTPGSAGTTLGQGNGLTSDNSVSSLIKRALNSDFMKDSQVRGGLVKGAAEMIAKGFSRNPQAEWVDVQKQRLAAEQAELARQIANRNNIPQVQLNQGINPNANLYPQGNYAPIGILKPRMA